MATEIGRLIAVFEADTSKFTAASKQVEASMKQTADSVNVSQKKIGSGELSLAQQLKAAESLQKQRSKALIQQWKEQEKAALQAASGTKSFREVLQDLSNSIGRVQSPLSNISGRVTSLNGAADELTSTMSTAGVAVVSATAAIVAGAVAAAGAITRLTLSAAEATGKMHDLAQQTGFSVETLSALGHAAETSGGSIDTISASLGIFQRHMEEANQGNQEAQRLFKALNIDVRDNEKALRDAFSILSKLPAGAQQTALSLKLFGRSGREVQAVFKEAGADLDKFIATLRDRGVLVTTEMAKRGDDLSDSVTKLRQEFDALKRQVGEEFAPIISEALREFSRWLRDNQQSLIGTAREVGNLLREVKGLADFIYSISPLRLEVEIVRNIKNVIQDIQGSSAQPQAFPGVPGPPASPSIFERFRESIRRGPRPTGSQGGLEFNIRTETQTKEQVAAIRKANEEEARKVVEDQKKLQKQLDSLKRPAGGGGRGGKSPAEAIAEQAVAVARVELRGAEEIYRETLDTERRFFDQSLSSLSTYSQARINAENERFKKEKEVFAAEQELISSSRLRPGERDVKQKDLNQRIQAAELEHGQRLRQIDDDTYRERLANQEDFFRRQLALQHSSLQTLELQLRRAVESGESSAVEAEITRFTKLREIQQTETNRINAQLTQVSPTSERAAQLRDDLKLLQQQIERDTVQHYQNLDTARRDDVNSAQRYSEAIQRIYTDIASINRETLTIELQALEENSFFRTEVIRRRAELERAAESERSKIALQELARRKELIRVEIMDEYEKARQIIAIDQQIDAEKRNSVARQAEITRRAIEEEREKWREFGEDVAGIISAGMRGGLQGLLDEVKSVLDQISAELLKSAIVKLINPNLPTQGSQAGGIIGAITNKILESIGLGPKTTPPGIIRSTGQETRPRTVGDAQQIAVTRQVSQRVDSASTTIVQAQSKQTLELNQARASQTNQLVSQLQMMAEHICQCSAKTESPVSGILQRALGGVADLLTRPRRVGGPTLDTSATRPRRVGPAEVVEVVLREVDTGEVLQGASGGGGTRPRQVFTQTGVETRERRVEDAIIKTGDRTVASVGQLGQTMAQQLQLNAQTIVAGLTPKRQGFFSGLLQAALGGAVSGLTAGITGGLFGGSGNQADEGPAQPRPTTPPTLGQFQRRAKGGSIKAGQPYIVGERGQELFVSNTDGRIVPNNQVNNFYQQISKEITKEIVSPSSMQDRMKDLQLKVSIMPERESGTKDIRERIERSLKEHVAERMTMVPSRQYGGPVSAGQFYRVHDEEYFSPAQSGTIYNQQQMSEFNQRPTVVEQHITVNVPVAASNNVSTPKSRRQLGDEIASALQNLQR